MRKLEFLRILEASKYISPPTTFPPWVYLNFSVTQHLGSPNQINSSRAMAFTPRGGRGGDRGGARGGFGGGRGGDRGGFGGRGGGRGGARGEF